MWQTIKDYLRYIFVDFIRLVYQGKQRVALWTAGLLMSAQLAERYVDVEPARRTMIVAIWNLIPWWAGPAIIAVVVLHTLILDNVKLRQGLKPRLRIDFDGNRFPYRQIDPIGDGSFALRTFRISVENIGGEPITDVAVELIDMTPRVNVFIPVRLSRRRDNIPSDESYAAPFKINRDQTQFVDVVKKLERLEGNGNYESMGQIILAYATMSSNMIPDGNYNLTLAATGSNCPRITQEFIVAVTDGELVFRMV